MDLKKKSISQLKKQADDLVSQFVRRSTADWKGYNSCFTCGITKHYKELQCGHYVSRTYNNLRWSLLNLRPQCYSCNVMKRGNMDEFAVRLEKETPGILKQLNMYKHMPSGSIKRLELIKLIEEFKEKLRAVEN